MHKNNTEFPLYIADHLFFSIEDGQVLIWNYKLHEQYLVEEKYFLELLHLSKTNTPHDKKICTELLKANVITNTPTTSQNWGWDVLSKIFHLGTQNVCGSLENIDTEYFAKKYIAQCAELKNDIPNLFLDREGILIDLPKPNISLFEKISFFSVLKNRKTCRNFNSEFTTLQELSLILYCSFGLIHGDWEELNQQHLEKTGLRKASPSSGGLHSEEAYLVVYRVDGLKQGLYHYRPQDHKLTQLKEGDFEKKIIDMNYKQFFSEGMSFGVYITSRLEKIWWKYKHSRSYRAMLLDIGHVSQTFLTCATALDMQTWITAAFHDSQVEDFLAIDGNKETVILFVGAGKGNNQSIPRIMQKYLK